MSSLEISVPIGISMKDLSSISQSFASLFGEVSRKLESKEIAVLKLVGHRKGSLVLECEPLPADDVDVQVVDRVSEVMISGLKSLSRGKEPFGFTNAALKHAASFVRPFTTQNSTVVITSGDTSVTCEPIMRTTALRFRNRRSVEWGTVEGRMETVSVHKGRTFNLYEVLSGEKIECRFDESKQAEVGAALGRRVVVSGEIHRRGGEISFIELERFRVRPHPDDLPTFADITGLFGPNDD